jgi:hypothetical protein
MLKLIENIVSKIKQDLIDSDDDDWYITKNSFLFKNYLIINFKIWIINKYLISFYLNNLILMTLKLSINSN